MNIHILAAYKTPCVVLDHLEMVHPVLSVSFLKQECQCSSIAQRTESEIPENIFSCFSQLWKELFLSISYASSFSLSVHKAQREQRDSFRKECESMYSISTRKIVHLVGEVWKDLSQGEEWMEVPLYGSGFQKKSQNKRDDIKEIYSVAVSIGSIAKGNDHEFSRREEKDTFFLQ